MKINIQQLEQLNPEDSLILGYVIISTGDKFETYTADQIEDSDPNPIFTGTAQETVNFFKTL